MDVAQRKFFIDPGWSRAWLLVVPVGLIWAYLWPWPLAALYCSVLFVFPVVFLLLVPSVELGRDGMRINRINRIRWSDISAVQYKRFMGLPYLKVRKASGYMDWWVPLYVRRPVEFCDAVRELAPRDSPMRETVEMYYTQQIAAADAGTTSRSRRH